MQTRAHPSIYFRFLLRRLCDRERQSRRFDREPGMNSPMVLEPTVSAAARHAVQAVPRSTLTFELQVNTPKRRINTVFLLSSWWLPLGTCALPVCELHVAGNRCSPFLSCPLVAHMPTVTCSLLQA